MRWRRLPTGGPHPSPLVSVAACTVARRAEVRWTAARRGSCGWRRLSTRDARSSPLVSSPPVQRRGEQLCAGQRRGEAALRWRRSLTRGLRPSLLAFVTASTAARRGICGGAAGSSALAPPLGLRHSRRPSVASHLRRRLDSGAASSCALAPPLISRRPSVASCLCRRPYSGAARQLCAGQRPGEAAMRWTAARKAAVRWRRYRLEASVRRLSSHRRLDSGAARRLCARQRRGEAAMRWTARGKAAVRWRRLLTRGLRPSHLLARSPPVQWRGEQRCAGRRRGEPAVHWRRLSISRRLSVASHLRRRLYGGAASSRALGGSAAEQLCAGQRRGEAAVRWTAARRGGCVLAPLFDSRPPSVASCLCHRLYSGAASSCALDSGAAKQLCAGAACHSRDARPSPRVSVAACTAARRAAVRWAAARLGCADNAEGLVQRLAQPPH